jgi:hypothetical protein
MRAIAVAVLAALLSVAPAFAQSKSAPKHKAAKAVSKNGAAPCAEYGAGFVQIEGTRSCVQMRGYLRIQGSTR